MYRFYIVNNFYLIGMPHMAWSYTTDRPFPPTKTWLCVCVFGECSVCVLFWIFTQLYININCAISAAPQNLKSKSV